MFGLGKEIYNTSTENPNISLIHSPDRSSIFKPIVVNPVHPITAGCSSGRDRNHHPTAATAEDTINTNGEDQGKRKRGRGRSKMYRYDGSVVLALPAQTPTFHAQDQAQSQAQGQASYVAPFTTPVGNSNVGHSPVTPQPPPSVTPVPSLFPASEKKPRRRSFGTRKRKAVDGVGSAMPGVVPHVILIKPGEDVFSKIISFSQSVSRSLCTLSATGAISNVMLRQPETSSGMVTYEGRFEILTLSGSFILSENGGHRSRIGGLSVALASPDGRVLGGGVAGLMTAASLVQVVVGTFIASGVEGVKATNLPGPSAPPQGIINESSSGSGSPPGQSARFIDNNSNMFMPWL